jgi:hypothetical protein
MCQGRMRKLIVSSGALFLLLAIVFVLPAQTFTSYALRDSGGNLLNPGLSDDYDLLVDGNGNLHILWSEGGYIYYGRVIYNATSGQFRVSGKEYTGVNYYQDGVSSWFTQPRAAVRRDGQTVHIVWGQTLKHAWRNPQGVWSKETVRSVSGNQVCRSPSVLVDDSETVHILYGYYDGSNGYDPTHLIYQRKLAGSSWSGYMEIDYAGYLQGAEWRNPVMALDAQGGIHATWSNQIYWMTAYGGAARYRYAPAGTGLEAATTVVIPRASGVLMSGVGNIIVDPSGKVHRTVCSSDSSIDYTSKPSGASGSWAAPSRASIGLLSTPEDSWSTLTTDTCGRVLVAFPDGSSAWDYPKIYLSVLEHGHWTKYSISTSAGLDFFRQPVLVSAGGTLFLIWRERSGQLYLATTPDSCGSLTVTSPNGGEVWLVGESRDIIWSSTGTVGLVNIDYSTNSGANWTAIVRNTTNDGLHPWTVPNTPSSTCLLRVREVDGSPGDTSNALFSITAHINENVSAPTTPSGASIGTIGTSYAYSTGGSTTSLGHAVQYMFDWGDGTNSGWLSIGMVSASHIWAVAGIYDIKAKARCATHPTNESPWSTALPVIISGGGVSGHYNSPAQYKVLPEVIWAPATGSGAWMSAVQITDITGGSRVNVYYNTASGRRGPFLLWDNSAGAALSSAKYANLLQTIDDLDGGVFIYCGTVGAVEFITQDGSHAIHAAARTLNGNYAKTLTAVSLHDANTAASGRSMIIPNLSNNASYRSSCGFFNPATDSVTVEYRLLDGSGSQVGAKFSKTLAGHGFVAFNPFTQAGVPYSLANAYGNAILRVQTTAGAGKVMSFGASVDNTSNDPAAHVAVQEDGGYDNGPSSLQILPEAIWSAATGGGTWMSAIQLTDVTGGSVVSVYYNTASKRRGPFLLWDNSRGSALSSMKYANLLQTIDNLDGGAFTYYGTVGAVEFFTQDHSHVVQAAARTQNGSYAKTLSALNLVEAETAAASRAMLILNYANNGSYRATCGFYNPTAASVTVEYKLLDGSGAQIGSKFSKTLAGHGFVAFNPFSQAGMMYPGNAYGNAILRVRTTAGAGAVMCFGATVNNDSNDPASHLAVQWE